MRIRTLMTTLAMAAMLGGAPALADSHSGIYTAKDLLSPCQEADNDARWGAAAEAECEQYILGFVGALEVTGAVSLCLPEQNLADEARWAFMRWVHASYSERTAMPASAVLLEMLVETFACE